MRNELRRDTSLLGCNVANKRTIGCDLIWRLGDQHQSYPKITMVVMISLLLRWWQAIEQWLNHNAIKKSLVQMIHQVFGSISMDNWIWVREQLLLIISWSSRNLRSQKRKSSYQRTIAESEKQRINGGASSIIFLTAFNPTIIVTNLHKLLHSYWDFVFYFVVYRISWEGNLCVKYLLISACDFHAKEIIQS